jgi:outer membrane protein TolC
VVNDWATNLYARYLLFDFGRRWAALDAATADAERLRLLEAAGRRDVRFTVTAAYHDLVRARAAVRLWEDTVGLFERHERLAAAQHEAGAALRSDLLSVQVRLGEARERRLTAGHDAEIARTHLATAVGVPTAEVEVPERPVARPVYAGEETALVRDAREAHPTIAALDAAARAARAGERAAARGSLPTVGAEVRGEWHGHDEDPGVDRRSYFAAVVVDFPFFQGGRTLAARNEARARRREVEAARREAADALEEAARTAHRRALEAAARIQAADAAVGAARAALGIVEERYRAGMARIVDLLEAERALTQARLRALDARAAAVIALAAVERVARREGE